MQTNPTDIYLITCGNCTALGMRAGITATSIRAGFSFIERHPDFLDDWLEPIRLGTVPYLEETLDVAGQLEALGKPALLEALTGIVKQDGLPSRIPLLVGLPEKRPGIPDGLDAALEEGLTAGLPNRGIAFDCRWLEKGHTSGILALEEAVDLLHSRGLCVIGGVDSYMNDETIDWLEFDAKRLFCSWNKNGFIPGQAAGFCLLASGEAVKRYTLTPQARILSAASAEEPRPFEGGTFSSAEALTQSAKTVLNFLLEGSTVDAVYTTENGEDYQTLELSNTLVNLGSAISDVGTRFSICDCLGDIGAASVPVLLSQAAEAAKKRYARGPLTLFLASSLGNSRAAALAEFFINTTPDNR